MTTPSDPTSMLSDDDRHVAVTDERRRADQAASDAAVAARAAFGFDEVGYTARMRLRVLEADCLVEETAARLTESTTIHQVARHQRAVRLRAAYRDRERTRQRAALVAAQALEAELRAGLADRQAVAAQVGVVDSGGHPHAQAVVLVQTLERYGRELNPSPPPPPPPPRPGTVRLRCMKAFADPDGGIGIVRRPNDVFDTRAEFVRDLVSAEVAEVVEVRG